MAAPAFSEITFEELYAEWLPAHRPYVAESTVRSYQSAYGHLHPLYGMPIKEIKYANQGNQIQAHASHPGRHGWFILCKQKESTQSPITALGICKEDGLHKQ